jgi:hypothetical protein
VDEQLEQLRLLLARRRAERGEDAPTLGRLFADTPGVPSPDDDDLAARRAMRRGLLAVPLEVWAGEDPRSAVPLENWAREPEGSG